MLQAKVRQTSGSFCKSSASITGGILPSSLNSQYMDARPARPISEKDGGTTLSKDG